MYLNAKRYLWSFPEDGLDATTAKAIGELLGVSNTRVKQIEIEAMYWRKANAIHKWFVDNVQKGTDDCGTYDVSRDQLQELLDLIIEVIDSKNSRKLPPASGFFFGSTEVGEWYWDDLNETKDRLSALLTDSEFEKWEFTYHSSW
jgi:hypothetical protein